MSNEWHFGPDDVVRHVRFGIGRVEIDRGRTVLVRFDHGYESCEKEALVPVVSLYQALDGVRWQAPLPVVARSQAEAIRSVNDTWGVFSRSHINLLPHQLWVCRRVLDAWPTRWLVADDVGLGKTVEAGLILWPLLARKRVKRLLILCPAGLVEQWQYRLRSMFDIRVARYLTEADTEKADFFGSHPQVVASLQTLREDRKGRRVRLLESEPWDLLIVDEAHHLNADEKERPTLGYGLVKELVDRDKVASMVFFTGTPHRGKNYGFLSLLHLLRPDLFDPSRPFEGQLPLLGQVMIRNNKQSVTDLQGRRQFQKPDVRSETYHYSPAEARFYEMLTEFILTGKAYASSLDATKGRAVMLVLITMQKLASSSVAAIRRALERRLELLASRREQMATNAANLAAAVSAVVRSREQAEMFEDDDAANATDEELIVRLSERLRGQLTLMQDEEGRLRELVAAGRAVTEETKIAKVLSVIDNQFGDRPVLLFTEYKATQALMMAALMRRFGDGCVTFINGDNRVEGVVDSLGNVRTLVETRESAADKFNSGAVRFLVSTEAGGEGIDLQERCHSLIHVDLPWNPMRLHQRVGRLNRYGQTRRVEVVSLHNPDTVESRICAKLNEKIELIMQAFARVMDEPEDLMQLVLGMTSPSLFNDLFCGAAEAPVDSLTRWFDQKTAQLGGKDVIETVRELVGHCASFNFQQVSADLPRLDLPALKPFLVNMLTFNNRRVQESERGLSFITPDAWRDPALRSSYADMIFDRDDRSRDAAQRVLGVGHKVIDLALEQALAGEEAVTTLPLGILEHPLLLFRVTDQVTGQGGTVRSVIVGVEGAPPTRILRDWEVIERLNAISERLGRQRWAKDSLPPDNVDEVKITLEPARQIAYEHLAYLDLPFKIPSVDMLTVLWPSQSRPDTEGEEADGGKHGVTGTRGSEPFSEDVRDRLQALVAGWREGETLATLHGRCRDAAGPGGTALVPDRVLTVRDLDEAALVTALRQLRFPGVAPTVNFRVQPVGQFDAVLVPARHREGACDHWILAVKETVPVREQVALYGHALGHLLLNREMRQIGQLPLLDPRDGYAHADTLIELRRLHDARNPLDRRVLDAYPQLAALLRHDSRRPRSAGGAQHA
jgi:superfamily II DNA or RNA helicase